MPIEKKIINITKMQEFYEQFVKERNWENFHNPKNLVMALSVEVAELVELFQWINEEQSLNIVNNLKKKQAVKEEMADIFSYLIRLATILNIDLEKAFWEKFEKNKKKYPIEKSKELALELKSNN
jgi:NTP pyrophosphatase (non-canonical NTP hydrolase)